MLTLCSQHKDIDAIQLTELPNKLNHDHRASLVQHKPEQHRRMKNPPPKKEKSVYRDTDFLGLRSDHSPLVLVSADMPRSQGEQGCRCFSLHKVELKPTPQRAENQHSTTYFFPAQAYIQRSLISESSCIIKEHTGLLPPTPAHVEDSCPVSMWALLSALSRAGMDPTTLLSAFPRRR